MVKLAMLTKMNKNITQRMIGSLDNKIRDKIIDAIEEVTGVPWNVIRTRGRKRENVEARHLYHYFMKKKTGLKHFVIGIDTNRDRTSVIHSVKTINNLLENNKEIQRFVVEINRLIG